MTARPPDQAVAAPAGHDFDALYAASFQRLALQLYAYMGDLGGAQDVVQEAFCRAYVRWRTLQDYADPEAWVRRVAWNLAKSQFRRQRTVAGFLRRQRMEVVPEPSPDRVALVRALAGIAPTRRRVLVMHYMVGMSTAQIAEHESVAEGTVKSWLSRGRAELAAQLKEGVDHDA